MSWKDDLKYADVGNRLDYVAYIEITHPKPVNFFVAWIRKGQVADKPPKMTKEEVGL